MHKIGKRLQFPIGESISILENNVAENNKKQLFFIEKCHVPHYKRIYQLDGFINILTGGRRSTNILGWDRGPSKFSIGGGSDTKIGGEGGPKKTSDPVPPFPPHPDVP